MKRQSKSAMKLAANLGIKLALTYTFSCTLLMQQSYAAPASGSYTFQSLPDGGQIEIKGAGDEYLNWLETREGYVVELGHDGFYYFVAPDLSHPTGYSVTDIQYQNAQVTDLPYLRGTDMGEIQRRLVELDLIESSLESASAGGGNNLSASETQAIRNRAPLLFLLIDFEDVKGTVSVEHFANSIDKVKQYFHDASYGNAQLRTAWESNGTQNDGVIGWLTLPYPHPNPGNDTARDIFRDAIRAADPYIDFASYDQDGDGTLLAGELSFTMILAGPEQSISRGNFGTYGGATALTQHMNTDENILVGGPFGNYSKMGELHSGRVPTVGIMIHELGHSIFFVPDLYDYDSSSTGVGVFDVMGTGTWTRLPGEFQGATPTLPSAWTKNRLGWINPAIAEGSVEIIAAGADSATQNNVAAIKTTSDVDEFFLVENRRNLGWDRGIGAFAGFDFEGGVIIYHIDSFGNNSNDANRMVDVEDAIPTGFASDNPTVNSFWKGSTATYFGDTTTPNSRLYNGTSTGFEVFVPAQAADSVTVSFDGNLATPAPTPIPTSAPIITEFEAELGSSYGGARIYDDGAASGGQGIAYISSIGAGFSITNLPTASEVTLKYASEQSGKISISINGADATDINFSSTGSWVGNYQEVSATLNIPENATLDVYYDSGDAALNVDLVKFSVIGNSTPTPEPTQEPTPVPTAVPTAIPTPTPTSSATPLPTATPTAIPTTIPTALPTSTPQPTATPTVIPTVAPTSLPTATPTPAPTVSPTPQPTATPIASNRAAFGLEYVDSSNGILYHEDNGWTAGFVYLCFNNDCRVPELANGYYERTLPNLSEGSSYTIEFKVQDNAIGQCLSGAPLVTFLQGGADTSSACD